MSTGLAKVRESARNEILAVIAMPGDDLEELGQAVDAWLEEQVQLAQTTERV